MRSTSKKSNKYWDWYKRLGPQNKIAVWAVTVGLVAAIPTYLALFKRDPQPAAVTTTTANQGAQSNIYQANRDVIIYSAPSNSAPQTTPTPQHQSSPEKKAEPLEPKKRVGPSQQSRHLSRAKSLYAAGRYHEALRECDAEIQINPHNENAIALRKQISKTIEVLEQQ